MSMKDALFVTRMQRNKSRALSAAVQILVFFGLTLSARGKRITKFD